MSALALSALPGSAFAQLAYVPYGASQSVYPAQPQVAAPVQQPAPVQQYVYVPQQPAAPGARQQYYSAPNAPQQYYYAYARQPRDAASAPMPRYTPSSAATYAAAEPAYTGTVQPRYATAVLPARMSATPSPAIAAPPAAAAPAPVAVASSSQGGRGFLESIFGGPTINVQRAYQPAMPGYQTAPAPQPAVAAPTVAYAPSSQGNMASYQADPKYDRQVVAYRGEEKPGTVIIDTPNKFLYLVEDGGRALRYGIGVGRPGFTWSGVKAITAKREWPEWRPPADMLQRRPDLPRYMAGGIDNPLGARAMYLGSTLYRIHGSNEPWTIGTNVSSGCIRMRNEDVSDLYNRVRIGTKVVVI
jgi:lipoprotein-anchoring transpeptidase ErfK/SrfK